MDRDSMLERINLVLNHTVTGVCGESPYFSGLGVANVLRILSGAYGGYGRLDLQDLLRTASDEKIEEVHAYVSDMADSVAGNCSGTYSKLSYDTYQIQNEFLNSGQDNLSAVACDIAHVLSDYLDGIITYQALLEISVGKVNKFKHLESQTVPIV